MNIVTFQKSGDFYESIGDEARITASVCGLTLTVRRSDGEAMCGFPVHSSQDHFADLIRAGYFVGLKPA